MKEIQHHEFEQATKKGSVVLDFWADWCVPCKKLLVTLQEVEKDVPHVSILKVNVDENPELARMFGVRGVPVLVFMKNGSEVSRTVGYLSHEEFKSRASEIK